MEGVVFSFLYIVCCESPNVLKISIHFLAARHFQKKTKNRNLSK